MIASDPPASADAEVAGVARALAAQGSVRESLAMLRGALARDPGEDECRALLAAILADDVAADESGDSVASRLDLGVVDRWIRAGMLVEALALLGGTPLGSHAMGGEWANLLGELLAPVPFDADERLVAMYRALLSGGASVALSLLEERARLPPPIPAWAARRMDLLRWMLLDNASVAEAQALLPEAVPSLLAGAIREPIHQRNLPAALEAARQFHAAHPRSRDAARVVEALAAILREMQIHAENVATQLRTLPILGRPAAGLQLRMGNLAPAGSIYRKIIARGDDELEDEVIALGAHVDAVLRALEGEPVADTASVESPWGQDTTNVVLAPMDDSFDEPSTQSELRLDELAEDEVPRVPKTNPPPPPGRPVPEESGPLRIRTDLSRPDFGPTEQMPNADAEVERLLGEGRFDDAEAILRGFAAMFPEDPTHAGRLAALRAQRLDLEDRDVVVRVIRLVE